MNAYAPQDQPSLLAPPPSRDLPPVRHAARRAEFLAAIAQDQQAAAPGKPQPFRSPWLPRSWRPVLAIGAAAVVVAGIVGWDINVTGGDPPPVTARSTGASPSAAASPDGPVPAKIRGYGTVAQLTAHADLIVRGTVTGVTATGATYRVDEVLHASPGVTAGPEITVVASTVPGASALAVGAPTVLYLAAAEGGFATISGDFGVFDVVGDTAVARSRAMSVSGLREEDATAGERTFTATLAQLRQLVRERTR